MPATVPTKAAGGGLAGRRVAAGCLGASAAGVAGSLGLALLPMVGGWKIEASSPLQLLPFVSACLALAGGAICLATARKAAVPVVPGVTGAELPAGALTGLQSIVRELGSLLVEERSRVATLQEICSAGLRDSRTASTRVENLAEAALDAETRLSAGVAKAAEVALHVQNALPEIAEMVRRGIAEAIAERLKEEADTSLQVLRAAVTEAAGQMAGLGETAGSVRQNVSALESAGKEITVASATVVSRLGGAIGQIEAATAALPTATADLTEAAEQAARGMQEASDGLRAETAGLTAGTEAMQRAAAELRASGETVQAAGGQVAERIEAVAGRIEAASAALPASAASIIAAAEQAGRTLADASVTVAGETSALAAAAQDTRQSADMLRTSGQAVEDAGSRLVSLVGDAVAHVDAVLAEIPQAVTTVTIAAEQAAQTFKDVVVELRDDGAGLAAAAEDVQAMLRLKAEALHDASNALRDDGLALAGSAREAQDMMHRQADTLKAASYALGEMGQQTVVRVAQAADHVAAIIAEADLARQAQGSIADLTVALENVVGGLVEGASKLETAGERVSASAEAVARRLEDAAQADAALHTLPALAADMEAAAKQLRDGTSTLITAADQLAAAGDAAGTVVAQAGDVAAALGTTGTALGEQIERWSDASLRSDEATSALGERLAGALQGTESQSAALGDVAASLAAVAERLGGLADASPQEHMQSVLLDAVGRLESVTSRLAELDTLSARLERVVGGERAAEMDEPAATLAGLSADIGESVRRVEAALADHDGIWPTLQTSISQVQAAAVAVVKAAATERAKPAFDEAGAPAALATTLRHLQELDGQAQALVQQTEALAEAVLGGRAPGLPALLADRTPGLLTGIEATTRRLRSIATALALASDGAPVAARRAV